MWWFLGGIAALVLTGIIALQFAIGRNGPAVLDAVDRITAGNTHTARPETVQFGSHPAQKLVIQHPHDSASNAALPVLVFQHGGSWKDGDPEDYGFVGRSFVPHGFVTVLAGYRLNEAGKYPAMLEDGADALAWITNNIAQHGGDPDQIILMGHSAGAYNVAMLALDHSWLESRSVPVSAIRGVIGLAGPYDFYPFDSDSTRAAFGDAPDALATQPINFTGEHAPPFLLIHGEQDTTVKPRNSQVLAERLGAAGIEVELQIFSAMDHKAPLLHLASPWRRDPAVHQAIRQFAASVQTSVPVQAETR